jgi:hypothetical protein
MVGNSGADAGACLKAAFANPTVNEPAGPLTVDDAKHESGDKNYERKEA